MNRTGTVHSIQVCPGHRKSMQFAESVEAITGSGLKGDMHALPGSTRQVLLVELETLNVLKLLPGIIKENITTEGISLMDLELGTRLRIGRAILQITKMCKPCYRMDEIREGLQSEIDGRRGMLAQVVEGGTIRLGDPITLL